MLLFNNNNNIFLTLPGGISVDKNLIKSKLSLKIYFYLFFLFRFFIFKESLFFFSSIMNFIFDNKKFIKKYIKNNLDIYLNYFFKLNFLLLKNCNKIEKINKYINNINIQIYYYITLNNNIYYYLMLYIPNKISLYLFKEFIIRIPFTLFIGFKSYILNFKIFN